MEFKVRATSQIVLGFSIIKERTDFRQGQNEALDVFTISDLFQIDVNGWPYKGHPFQLPKGPKSCLGM